MHGRESERHTIATVLDKARGGQGGVLVLRGEAGIGKTTMLLDAVQRSPDMRVLTCSGVESEVELAFSGLHQLLTPVLDDIDSLPTVQADTLRRALGLAESGTTVTGGFLVGVATLALLAQVAERRPLLVVADDLQWLDRASAGALLFTSRRLVAEPMAVLMGLRDPTDRHVDTADLPELRLSGLGMAAASRLLAEQGWPVPVPALAAMVDATGGNPLALAELTPEGDSSELIGGAALRGTVPLGPRLHAAFTHRANGLPSQSRDMLLVAAADDTGRTGTVTGAAARLGLPDAALVPAEESGLIEINGAELRFRHPLIRSAIYQDAPFGRRSEVHDAIADHLAQAGETDHATWHRAVAATAPDEELAVALEASADAASRRGGGAAVTSIMQRAAELSGTQTDRARRLSQSAWAAWRSGQSELAKTLAQQSDGIESDLATQAGLARLRGFIELFDGDPAAAYAALCSGADFAADGEPTETVNLLVAAVEAAYSANRIADSITAARRITMLNVDPRYHRLGHWLAAAAVGRVPVEEADPWHIMRELPPETPVEEPRRWTWALGIARLGPALREAHGFGVTMCGRMRAAGLVSVLTLSLPYLAEVDYGLGKWADGTATAEEGLRLARELGQRGRVGEFLALLALFAAARGDATACRRYAEQVLSGALPPGNRLAAARATWALGQLELASGDAEEAHELLADLDAAGSPHAHDHVARMAMLDLVEACVRTGRDEDARRVLAKFRPWAQETSLPWARVSLRLCEALLADGDEADERFRTILAIDHALDRPFDRARAALLYGEWLRRNRRQQDARRQLRMATTLFDQLGAQRWAQNARAQLRVTGGSVPRLETNTISTLTPQELQVAQLAARGLSNREIGAQLFLSPRTVGYHLYKLFPKLGITARSQLREIDFGEVVP